jgi:hypothetical protein
VDVDSGSVLILVVLVTLPLAAVAFAVSGPRWREIGKGTFAIEEEAARRTGNYELREEVRQLVIASNERRVRRGEAPLDVEEEVERQLRELAEL